MCGIFGIVAHQTRVPAGILERATQSLFHRGPDDGGTVILRESAPHRVEVALGSRRLAILDLSPLGHQPMSDPETGNWIVYNGEVYNFREVRQKLEREGLHFSSGCDTEVILKAYGRWGEHCLDHFRGMFAFAIWDAQHHRLFAARDPMGIKPFYFYDSSGRFIFSSEIRTLLDTGLVPRHIDSAGLVSYLTFGSLYDPTTLIEGVQALPPGHYLTWENGQLKQTQYWDLVDANQRESASRETQRTQLESEIYDSIDECVRMQLVSDVPVGVFLSGGIDSSALVGILSRSGVRPSTFSIVFREAEYSEAEYSRSVARHFRTDHHEIMVAAAAFFEAIDPAVRAMDLPTIDGINTYFVSEKARAAGVKVALSGLGGDEMFAGYSSFRSVPRMERFSNIFRHIPKTIRSLVGHTFSSVVPRTDQNRKLAALIKNSDHFVSSYFLSRMLFTPEQRNELLRGINSSAIQQAERPLRDALCRAQNLDSINRVSYLEARSYMLNTLLRDSDFMSMAHSLEVRVPLLDHHLARAVLALPGSWKLNASTPKPLLVHALRGELPDEIVHRPKRGFTLPFEQWLREDSQLRVEETLRRTGDGPLSFVMNAKAVLAVWKDFQQGRTSWSRPWSLYVLLRWCELHSVTA